MARWARLGFRAAVSRAIAPARGAPPRRFIMQAQGIALGRAQLVLGLRRISGWGRRAVSPEARAAAEKRKEEEAAVRDAQAKAQKAEGDALLQQARAKLAAGDHHAAALMKNRAAQEYRYGNIDETAALSAFEAELSRHANAAAEAAASSAPEAATSDLQSELLQKEEEIVTAAAAKAQEETIQDGGTVREQEAATSQDAHQDSPSTASQEAKKEETRGAETNIEGDCEGGVKTKAKASSLHETEDRPKSVSVSAAVAAAAAAAAAKKRLLDEESARERDRASREMEKRAAAAVAAREAKGKAFAAAEARRAHEAAAAAAVSQKARDALLHEQRKASEKAQAAAVAVAAARVVVVNSAEQQEQMAKKARERDTEAALLGELLRQGPSPPLAASSRAAPSASARASLNPAAAVIGSLPCAVSAGAAPASPSLATLQSTGDAFSTPPFRGEGHQPHQFFSKVSPPSSLGALANSLHDASHGGVGSVTGDAAVAVVRKAKAAKGLLNATTSVDLVLPDSACLARLIGPKGLRIRRMQTDTRARIVIQSSAGRTPDNGHDAVEDESGHKEVTAEVSAENPDAVASAVTRLNQEVEIEVLRAKMYALMGATDLTWSKRQQQRHLPARVRQRPIFRGGAALPTITDVTAGDRGTAVSESEGAVGATARDQEAISEVVYGMAKDMAKMCDEVGSQMLFKDYDSLMIFASDNLTCPNVQLASFVLDEMASDPLMRIEMRHWRAFIRVCVSAADLLPVICRLCVLNVQLRRERPLLCADVESYLIAAAQPSPTAALHALYIMESNGLDISPRLRKAFVHYHYRAGPVEESLQVLSGKGVILGTEALLVVLEAALQRKSRFLPYKVCKRLLQALDETPSLGETETPRPGVETAKIDARVDDALVRTLDFSLGGGAGFGIGETVASLHKAILAVEATSNGTWSWDLKSRLFLFETRAGRMTFKDLMTRMNDACVDAAVGWADVVESVGSLATAGSLKEDQTTWWNDVEEILAKVKGGEMPLNGAAAALLLSVSASREPTISLVEWYQIYETIRPHLKDGNRHRQKPMQLLCQACASYGQLKPAENTLDLMHKDGLEPDVVSYCLVTQAAIRARVASKVQAYMTRVHELVAAKAHGHDSSIVTHTEEMVHRFSSLSKQINE